MKVPVTYLCSNVKTARIGRLLGLPGHEIVAHELKHICNKITSSCKIIVKELTWHLTGCGGADPHNLLTSHDQGFFRTKQKLCHISSKAVILEPHKQIFHEIDYFVVFFSSNSDENTPVNVRDEFVTTRRFNLLKEERLVPWKMPCY